MRVLLKDGAEKATAATIIVIPQEIETTFVTLAGEAVPEGGIVSEADYSTVALAVDTGAKHHSTQTATSNELFEQAVWMARILSAYEVGSRIGLHIIGRGWALDTLEAKRIDRAEGLAEGDRIAVGPTIDSQMLVNARGRVISFNDEAVWTELDAGDRDRIERATARTQPKCLSLPRVCVEKVA
jgi:hypothetical protein